jgi:hypothetical protein
MMMKQLQQRMGKYSNVDVADQARIAAMLGDRSNNAAGRAAAGGEAYTATIGKQQTENMGMLKDLTEMKYRQAQEKRYNDMMQSQIDKNEGSAASGYGRGDYYENGGSKGKGGGAGKQVSVTDALNAMSWGVEQGEADPYKGMTPDQVQQSLQNGAAGTSAPQLNSSTLRPGQIANGPNGRTLTWTLDKDGKGSWK